MYVGAGACLLLRSGAPPCVESSRDSKCGVLQRPNPALSIGQHPTAEDGSAGERIMGWQLRSSHLPSFPSEANGLDPSSETIDAAVSQHVAVRSTS